MKQGKFPKGKFTFHFAPKKGVTKYVIWGEFGRSLYVIYSKDFEVKVENQGDYAIFLNLDITIKEGTF